MGCSAVALPFPTELPSDQVINDQFKTIRHDLSPLRQYHFEIVLPTDWEILDAKIIEEPAVDTPQEVAAFREPGAWKDDGTAAVNAEVTVTVLRASGSVVGADATRTWLKSILETTIPGYTLLEERSVTADGQGTADVLIQYGRDDVIVARFWALPAPDGKNVYVVIGSAPMEEYATVAEKLYTALATFKPTPGK